MTKTDLKFIIDNYKYKDEREETYYLTVKARNNDGSEVLLLSHLDNKTANGSKLLRKLSNSVKENYSELIIEEYKSFSSGSTGASTPVQTYSIMLNSETPATAESGITQMFGGLGGFGDFRERQGANLARLESISRDLDRTQIEKAELLTKLGTYEVKNEKLKSKISDLKDKIKDLNWAHKEKLRDLNFSKDDELRKYKGQSAIIQAGVQGLGGLLVKKLNITDADLQGLLGMDTQPQAQEQSPNNKQNPFNEVEVEPENLSPEQEQAKQIYNWMLTADAATMNKVYAVFQSLSSDEENLNAYFSMANPENTEVEI